MDIMKELWEEQNWDTWGFAKVMFNKLNKLWLQGKRKRISHPSGSRLKQIFL